MKNKDIIALSASDLKKQIEIERSTLEKLSLSHSVSPIDNPAKIRNTRRTIARLLTELKKKTSAA
jgi:large subunit ribosomal protein L29